MDLPQWTESALKSLTHINLVEEILRQHSIQAVADICLLLLASSIVRTGRKMQSRRIGKCPVREKEVYLVSG